MTHLSVDPACNTSLLVNKLVEGFILGFARGNPRQGIRRLHSLCIHNAHLLFGRHTGSCQAGLLLVGMEVRSMCGESLACLHPPTPHGQWVGRLGLNRLQDLRDLSVNTANNYHCNPLQSTGNITSPQKQLDGFLCLHFKVKLKEGQGLEPLLAQIDCVTVKLGLFCKHKKFNTTN